MSDSPMEPDLEFAAMRAVYDALEPLDGRSRTRVFAYVAARLEVAEADVKRTADDGRQPEPESDQPSESEFATLAELHDAAKPSTAKDRTLVGAYWLQVCEGADAFVSFDVNRALKDLGHGVSNITGALDILRRQKPALVLQLRKSGKSKQARKTYKVTNAGIEAVLEMTRG